MADSAAKLLDPPAADQQDTDEHPQPVDQAGAGQAAAGQAEVLAADLLVEEISIDGMCGVY